MISWIGWMPIPREDYNPLSFPIRMPWMRPWITPQQTIHLALGTILVFALALLLARNALGLP